MSNLFIKRLTALCLSGIFFFLTATYVLALPPLPPKPGVGSYPDMPTEPETGEFPPQPSLPPCLECDEFTHGPTVSVTPSPTTIPSVGGSSDGGGGGSTSGGSSSGGSSGGGGGGQGEVISLSTTSSDKTTGTLLGFLGVLLIISGLRLRKLSTKKLS